MFVFKLIPNLFFNQISDNQLSIQNQQNKQKSCRQNKQENTKKTAAEKQISDISIFYINSF